MSYAYETDGAAIYRRSFAIIRAEARLGRFDADDEKVAVRIIHASGMVDVADDIVFTAGFSAAASAALVRLRHDELDVEAGLDERSQGWDGSGRGSEVRELQRQGTPRWPFAAARRPGNLPGEAP